MFLLKCIICHDKQSVTNAQKKFPDAQILFVGSKEAPNNVIVMRNLPQNIEHMPQFLTFCAWWAITKNKLFLDAQHIALFEWDVELVDKTWWTKVEQIAADVDVVAPFKRNGTLQFSCDTSKALYNTLDTLGLKVPHKYNAWFPTSNTVIKREKLDEFVYIFETQLDSIKNDSKCKWFHERIFASWLDTQRVIHVPGLKHFQSNSHKHVKT